jgi:long-chain fatty acid transport protein
MSLKINTVVAGLLATTSTATAGGMDRATTGTSTLFEKGSYVELSYASTTPSVGPNATPTLNIDGGMNVTQSFTTTQFSFKTDFNDKLSVAISSNNNPFGVDVDYDDFATGGGAYGGAAGITSLRANLDSTAVTAMARYKITDRVSAIAALKYQTVSGTADVSVPLTAASQALGGPAVDGDVSLTRASDTNFIVGASYEIPEIALRVVGTYESEATFDPSVIAKTSGANTGSGQIKTPEVLMLEFQSGVAANTLVFGSIRHAKWEDAQVKMSAAYGNAQLSDFDNSTTYTLGVGRKFSDSFSASLSASMDTGDGDDASLLAPMGGSTAISLGGKYTLKNGMAISGGVSHRVYDSATWYGSDSALGGGDDVTFGDNSLTTLGIKLSYSF